MITALFVDDMQVRQNAFVEVASGKGWKYHQAYSVEDAQHMILKHNFDVVFLDHDLCLADIMVHPDRQSIKPTGTDLANWLTAKVHPGKFDVVIHTNNPRGAGSMASALEMRGFNIYIIPFPAVLQVMQCDHDWTRPPGIMSKDTADSMWRVCRGCLLRVDPARFIFRESTWLGLNR